MFVQENDPALAAEVLNGKHSVAAAERIIRDRSGMRDKQGRPIPKSLQKAFRMSSVVEGTCLQLNRLSSSLKDLPQVAKVNKGNLREHVQSLTNLLEAIQAYSVCSKCSGKGCPSCGQKGWQSLSEWKQADPSTRTGRTE
jgi:hypothetical protein